MHVGYGNTVYVSLTSLAFKIPFKMIFKNGFPFIGLLETNNLPSQVLSGRVFDSYYVLNEILTVVLLASNVYPVVYNVKVIRILYVGRKTVPHMFLVVGFSYTDIYYTRFISGPQWYCCLMYITLPNYRNISISL